jgi:uncharacterized protein (DUF302 family)
MLPKATSLSYSVQIASELTRNIRKMAVTALLYGERIERLDHKLLQKGFEVFCCGLALTP